MIRVIDNKTKENRNLLENTHEVETLSVQVKSLNEKIRKITG